MTEDVFERGLSPSEKLLWQALQMVGNGTLEVNTKLGRVNGADKVRTWVEESEGALGV